MKTIQDGQIHWSNGFNEEQQQILRGRQTIEGKYFRFGKNAVGLLAMKAVQGCG